MADPDPASDEPEPLASLLARYLAAAERLAETDPATAAAVRREIERVRAAIEAPQHVFPAYVCRDRR